MADAALAREQAREILADRRFAEPEVPRPFKGPLDWLGERVEDVGDWLADRFDGVDAALPGGAWVLWLLLAAAIGAAAFLLTRAKITRSDEKDIQGMSDSAVAEPRALERAADDAESAGDYARAVRLRFRAGVLRLRRETETTAHIAADLTSPSFDAIGRTHDQVAYGGTPATRADAEQSRERWKELV